jgi:hypothetical protein
MKRTINGSLNNIPEYAKNMDESVETAIDLAGECAKIRTCAGLKPYDKLNIIIYLTKHPEETKKSEIMEKFLCGKCETYVIGDDNRSENSFEIGSYFYSEIDESDLVSFCDSDFNIKNLDSCIESETKKCVLGYYLNKFIGHLCTNNFLIKDGELIKFNYRNFEHEKATYHDVLRLKCHNKLESLGSKVSSS